jgi:hypothetical protein
MDVVAAFLDSVEEDLATLASCREAGLARPRCGKLQSPPLAAVAK